VSLTRAGGIFGDPKTSSDHNINLKIYFTAFPLILIKLSMCLTGKTFLKELDPHNPSGSGGEMTFAFAQILFALWRKKQICTGMRRLTVYSYGNHLAIKPRKLKVSKR